jgi:TRAP-type uncharacterized transport system substrate-binding protein
MLMHRGIGVAFLMYMLFAIGGISQAQEALPEPVVRTPQKPVRASTAISEGEAEQVARLNNWVVGLVAGHVEGVLIHFASDIEKVLDDGENMRVLPIVSHGAKQNLLDLLYLKGVDLAYTHADVFEEFRREGKIKNIEKRVNYITQGHISAVHIFVRPEIKTLQDLEGKKVSFMGKGAGVAVTAPIIFQRMGVKVEPVYINNTIALEKMKTGELAGFVHLLTKKSDFFRQRDIPSGFHFLPVEYGSKFMDYYVPESLSHEDYPDLIEEGQTIETIGVPAVLAVYNWPKGSERHRRVERFIQRFFDHFEELRQPPFEEEWKNISLGAKVPGWTRYWVAEEMLKKMASKQGVTGSISKVNQTDPASSDADQQRLYDEFLQWKRTRSKP